MQIRERIAQVRGKVNTAIAGARELLEAAGTEDRALTPDELERWESLAGETGEAALLRRELSALEGQARHEEWLGKPGGPPPPAAPPENEVPEPERRQYSLANVLRRMVDRQPLEGLELEVHQAIADGHGLEARGSFVPFWALRGTSGGTVGVMHRSVGAQRLELRDVGKTVGGNLGAALVGTDHMAGSFIEFLRAASVVGAAGATVLPGLVGDVSIPKQGQITTGAWQNPEGGAISEADSGYIAVTLSPKTVGIVTDITRTMQKQSTPAVEDLVRADIAAGIGTAIDVAAMHGGGASGVPLGIEGQTGVQDVDGGAAALDWDLVVQAETDIATDNALRGALAYVINAGTLNTVKTTPKVAGQPIYLMAEDGSLNGYAVFVTQNAQAAESFFGNWSDLLIGQWGGLDLLTDPYTASSTGTVRITGFQDVDIAVRHGQSFAHMHNYT